jgi:hypothetical protein
MPAFAEAGFRLRLQTIDFLAKPFTLKQLAAKVKDVLGEAPGG